MTQPSELINRLEQLRDREDRARLASMRRGLGQPPGAVAETSRVIEHMLAEDDPPWVAETLYVIGPLFALQQKPFSGDRWSNMGDHFRSLYAENEEPPTNVERRFMALLASELDGSGGHVRIQKVQVRPAHHELSWSRHTRSFAQVPHEGDVIRPPGREPDPPSGLGGEEQVRV